MSTTVRATVCIDGATRALHDGCTLAELLSELGHEPQAIAVAVNGEFVPRALRLTHLLHDGDQVVCFKAIVGG
ncbi:MAG TPA: sulfur carrier protein ThiS [Albitalea sp.]|nr:sulfur carrier protein ThiS [Albitalea sp.]